MRATQGEFRPAEIVDWIAHHAEMTPHKCAMIDLASGRRYTYSQMHDRVGRLAAAMASMGVERGDRVAFLTLNTTDVLEIIFACWRIGAVGLALNYRLTAPEFAYIINDASPKLMFLETTFAEVGSEVRGMTSVPHWIELDGLGGPSPYETMIGEAAPITKMVDQGLQDQCLLMYSSGTTGRPKGIIITHGMMFFAGISGISLGRLTCDAVSLAMMPIFHIGGLNVSCTPTLRIGGTVVVVRIFDPEVILDAINDPDLGVNYLFAVPAAYNVLRMHPKNQTTDFSRIITATAGAETVPPSLINWWYERGVLIQEGYGMTETAAVGTLLPREYVPGKVGSSGKPLIHMHMRIVRSDGQDAKPNELGEIWMRGPCITPGYWNRPDADDGSFIDGWFRSGDVGRMDEEGFIYIEDRVKDMYISGGENIYPAEIEGVLYELPQIREVAVVGVPDERWGEVGVAVVVLHEGQSLTLDELLAHCEGKLARYKHPRHLVFVEMLPRNATGKVVKFQLRETVKDQLGEL